MKLHLKFFFYFFSIKTFVFIVVKTVVSSVPAEGGRRRGAVVARRGRRGRRAVRVLLVMAGLRPARTHARRYTHQLLQTTVGHAYIGLSKYTPFHRLRLLASDFC